MVELLVYFFAAIILYINVYLLLKFIEYFYCAFIARQPPNVTSSNAMKQKVLEQINTCYKNAKNICDIGSGYGSFTRFIAKNTKADVIGIENMAFSAFAAKVLDLFCFRNVKTIKADAYEFLDKTNIVFDVAIAYLGPREVQKLKKYKNKIRVLICLDFEIKNIKPTRIIDVGHGFTTFNHKKYPHKLFIYEFK